MPLLDVFLPFLRLGATAFGGPAVHIAMMETEFVERRKWLTQERFRQLMGAAMLIPGPTSTELALLIGQERAGLLGLFAAGIAFIFPAFLAVVAIAVFVGTYGVTPGFLRIMTGVKPVLIAIIFQALVKLSGTVFRAPFLYVCAALALVAGYFELNILAILFGVGALNMLYVWLAAGNTPRAGPAALFAALLLRARRLPAAEALAAGTAVSAIPDAWNILAIFLKMGLVFYGGGYVLLAFLHDDFVVRLKVLSHKDLLTAITVGQFTPGPLFTAATFVGYQLRGIPGAIAATVGIFSPAFLYAALSGLFVPRLQRSPAVGNLLDGVNAASWAVMALVLWHLQHDALVDWKTALIALAGLALIFCTKINPTWLVAAGAVIGYIVF